MQNSSAFQYLAIDTIHESTTNPRRTSKSRSAMGLGSQEHYNTVGCPILDTSWPWLTQSWAAYTLQNNLKKCAMVCQKVPLFTAIEAPLYDVGGAKSGA